MTDTTIALSYFLESLFALSALWLGLFIITRDWDHWRSRFAGSAVTLIGMFWAGIALMLMAENPKEFILIHKLTWWGAPVAIACWCATGLSFLSPADSKRRMLQRLVAAAMFFVAAVLVFVGVFTNLLFDYEQINTLTEPTVTGFFYLPFSSFHLVYELYDLTGLSISALCVAYAYYKNRKTQEGLGLLALASFLVVLGGVASSWSYSNQATLNLALASDAVIFFALATTGFSVARYNALVKRRDLSIDLRISLVGFLLILAAFIGVPFTISLLLNRWIPSFSINYSQLLFVTAVAIISILLMDYIRTAVDNLVGRQSARTREKLTEIIRKSREGASPETIAEDLTSVEELNLEDYIRTHLNKDLLRLFSNQTGDEEEAVANNELQQLAVVKSQYVILRSETSGQISEIRLRFLSLKTVLSKGVDEVKTQYPDTAYGQPHFHSWLLGKMIDGGSKRKGILDELPDPMPDRTFDKTYARSIKYLQEAILKLELEARKTGFSLPASPTT